MKTNLKENIWINGFDHDFKSHQFWFSKKHEIKEVIYLGKTSEIPEEIAKECVEYEIFDMCIVYKKYYNNDEWFQDWSENYSNFSLIPAKESIQSACNQEYCIIYKL